MPGKRADGKVLLSVWVDREELEAARARAGDDWPDVVRKWLRRYGRTTRRGAGVGGSA